MDIKEIVKEISVETLSDMPLVKKVHEDIESIRKYQEALCILVNDRDNSGLNILKIGTTLSFGIIGKIISGKSSGDFDKNDWKEIADNVIEYGVLIDETRYTESVFELLATYIVFSVDVNSKSIRDADAKEIKGLANEIRKLSKVVNNNSITEADYVDRCLWIAFEAMIKLLASYQTNNLCIEYADFIKAVADVSVQYGRYRIYQKELDLLNGYLEGQKMLDDELNTKYDAYIEEINKQSGEFRNLIEHAFDPDFEDRLRKSVMLAKSVGIADDMILDSKEKIDAFFID